MQPEVTVQPDAFVFRSELVPAQPFLRFADPRSVTVVEGDGGERFATFRILLSEPVSEPVRVRVDTMTFANSGWATEGVDYEGIHRTIRFLPGQTQKTITVRLFGDETYEPDELVYLQLSGARGAELDPDVNLHRAYVTIADDDLPAAAPDWMLV